LYLKIDTSEIEFYESTSEPFKKLVKELKLESLRIDTKKDGIITLFKKYHPYLNLDCDKYYLKVHEKIENIEFYVHEFTELVIKGVIQGITDNVFKEIQNESVIMAFIFLKNETIKTYSIPTEREIDVAHELSKMSEGDGIWGIQRIKRRSKRYILKP
jgi:hypothetical protein